METSKYIESILSWREKRNQQLIANPRNWLTLSGLFPLREGRNKVSTQIGADVQLPRSASPFAGVFTLSDGRVQLTLTTDPGQSINCAPLQDRSLRLDVDGDPDVLEFGQHLLMVIRRGDKFFLRLWDIQAPEYLRFIGLRYFPVDPLYRIIAAYEAFELPRVSTMINAIGIETETRYMGAAHFSVNGVECSLLAEESGDELLFNFTDTTCADSTYPGGRFLEIEPPADRNITLDFNMARNWPCAYTPFATCPLPPRENHLSVRIEAGELRFH